jgi:YD repeat-containing protein
LTAIPTLGGTEHWHLAYQYDAVGNLLAVNTNNSGSKLSAQYDANYRLQSASGAYFPAQQYTYDALGNVLTQNNTTYQYQDSAHPYAITAAVATYATGAPNFDILDGEAFQQRSDHSFQPIESPPISAALAFRITLGGVVELFHQQFRIVKIDSILEERFRGIPRFDFCEIVMADMAKVLFTRRCICSSPFSRGAVL